MCPAHYLFPWLTVPIAMFSWPLNSHKWLTCNLFLYYPYIFQQMGNKNTQAYQVDIVFLIEYQIHVTN